MDDWDTTMCNAPEGKIEDVPETLLNEGWMAGLFPGKDPQKRKAWLAVLTEQEFETVSEVASLSQDMWDKISLPLNVKSKIQSAFQRPASFCHPPSDSGTPEITQIDMIIVDVSGSMRARSSLDLAAVADDDPGRLCDTPVNKIQFKTREDVSKILFHTMIDKLFGMELQHAVGLIAFGEHICEKEITQRYERFHDELGRLDANQSRTKLYDAIIHGASVIAKFAQDYVAQKGACAKLPKKRVFILTDGEDNGSIASPWEVAQTLQQQGCMLDSIPLAHSSSVLQTLCTASGGVYFEASSQEQAVQLFEREATLNTTLRVLPHTPPPQIVDCAAFAQLQAKCESIAPVQDLKRAPSKQVHTPVLSKAAVAAAASSSTSMIAGGVHVPKHTQRRILKEFKDLCSGEQVPGCKVFISADNLLAWKATLSELPPPYSGGSWLLTIDFPQDYPFQPPKFRFHTPIYHCNISADGALCLDILKDAWAPALSIAKVFRSIRYLLANPNADDPLDSNKAALFRDDRVRYEVQAAAHTKEHASESYSSLCLKYNLS